MAFPTSHVDNEAREAVEVGERGGIRSVSLVANPKNVQLLTEQSGYYLDELQVRTTYRGLFACRGSREKNERKRGWFDVIGGFFLKPSWSGALEIFPIVSCELGVFLETG